MTPQPEPAPGGWSQPGAPPPPPPAWGEPGAVPLPAGPPGPGGAGQWGWAPTGPPPAPRPGVVPLRPLAVGELLDGAFTTIRRYPGPTLGAAAVVMLVIETVRIVLSYSLLRGIASDASGVFGSVDLDGSYTARIETVQLAVLVVTVLGGLVVTGVMAVVIGKGALGRPMTAAEAWRASRPRLARLLGVVLLTAAIVLGLMLAGALPGIVVAVTVSPGAGAGLAVLGLLPAVVAAVYVWVSLSFAPAVVMLEQQPVVASLRRSRQLVRGGWWRVFGISLLGSVLGSVMASILALPFAFAGGLTSVLSGHPGEQFHIGNLLLTGLGGLLAGAVARPFTAGVQTLLYIDRRIRREALDLTLVAEAAGDSA